MPVGSIPSLATPEDVVARLGRNLNQVETARVEALLADGSAIIRRYCRRDFLKHEAATREILAHGNEITIPQQPVLRIRRLETIGPVRLNITWFRFVPPATIVIPGPEESGIINLPEMEDFVGGLYRLIWDYGYDEVPDEVVAVLCSAITSELSAPTMSGAVVSESVGAYSYAMRRTSGAGIRAALVDAGLSTLDDFRTKRGTISLMRF